MTSVLQETGGARVDAVSLPALADLRGHADIRVKIQGDSAWLRWRPGDEEVVRRVFSLSGATLFIERENIWYEAGRRLPASGLPFDSAMERLEVVLVPEAIQFPLQPARQSPELRSKREARTFRLVRDQRVQNVAGMRSDLAGLAPWVEMAPSSELSAVRAARSGSAVFLLGSRLPWINGACRYWGRRVLVPLGQCIDPPFAENALLRALEVSDGDFLVADPGAWETIPGEAFEPLSRAGFRRALEEAVR